LPFSSSYVQYFSLSRGRSSFQLSYFLPFVRPLFNRSSFYMS
jgi:hypothetical protein